MQERQKWYVEAQQAVHLRSALKEAQIQSKKDILKAQALREETEQLHQDLEVSNPVTVPTVPCISSGQQTGLFTNFTHYEPSDWTCISRKHALYSSFLFEELIVIKENMKEPLALRLGDMQSPLLWICIK